MGPRLCGQSHASTHTCTRSKSRVAALTSANTRPEMSISFCCGTSLWSLHWIPKEDALRSLRCAFSFFPTRGKCERKGREVKQTNKLLSVDHSGRELKGVPDAALSCDDPHSVHLFLPLNLCPDHPSCKTALPRAESETERKPEVTASTRDEALFHCTTPSGDPRGRSGRAHV